MVKKRKLFLREQNKKLKIELDETKNYLNEILIKLKDKKR